MKKIVSSLVLASIFFSAFGMEKPSLLSKLKAAITRKKDTVGAYDRLIIPDSSSEPYDEEFKKSFTNQFHQFVHVDLHKKIMQEMPIEDGYKEIAENFYISKENSLDFRSKKIEKSISFNLTCPQYLPNEKEIATLKSGDYIVSIPFLSPRNLYLKNKDHDTSFDLLTGIKADIKIVENVAIGTDKLPFIFCVLFTSPSKEYAKQYVIIDLSSKKVIFQKELDLFEARKFSEGLPDQPCHIINPHYALYKYLVIDEPNAGLLTQKATMFVHKKNPDVKEGMKILQKFHDPRYIKNKYRLIKFTECKCDYGIYEKVHARVKHLSGITLSDRQKCINQQITDNQEFLERQNNLRQNKKKSILDQEKNA